MAARFLVRLALLLTLSLLMPPGGAAPVQAREGFPCVDFLPISPEDARLRAELASVNCVERDRFEVGGRQFLFIDVEGYDPPDREARQRAAREAIQRSVPLFSTWFSVPDTLFISGRLTSAVDPATGRSSVLAETRGDDFSCVVSVDDSAIHTGRSGLDPADYMRTLSHELFHCVHRTDPTVHNWYVPWRDEGAAEYFSGLAIPEAPANNSFGDDLPTLIRRPIYELGSDAYPFITYLGRQRGTEAVVALLRGAARDRSPSGSLTTLRSISSIDEFFHAFVKAWFDGYLTDANGASVVYPIPAFLTVTRVETARSLELGEIKPFMVAARKFELARGMAWRLETPEQAPTQASWRVVDEADWTHLTATIDNCDRARVGVIVATWTEGRVDSRALTSNAVERPGEMTACRCPVGQWSMDAGTVAGTMVGTASPGELTGGGVTLTFDGAGNATATYDDLSWDFDMGDGGGIRRTLQGTISWKWARKPWSAAGSRHPEPTGPGVDALALERTTTAVNANWLVQFLSRGSIISSQSTPFRSADQAGSISIATAVCNGSTLTLGPGVTSASGGDLGPPWHGVYQRR